MDSAPVAVKMSGGRLLLPGTISLIQSLVWIVVLLGQRALHLVTAKLRGPSQVPLGPREPPRKPSSSNLEESGAIHMEDYREE